MRSVESTVAPKYCSWLSHHLSVLVGRLCVMGLLLHLWWKRTKQIKALWHLVRAYCSSGCSRTGHRRKSSHLIVARMLCSQTNYGQFMNILTFCWISLSVPLRSAVPFGHTGSQQQNTRRTELPCVPLYLFWPPLHIKHTHTHITPCTYTLQIVDVFLRSDCRFYVDLYVFRSQPKNSRMMKEKRFLNDFAFFVICAVFSLSAGFAYVFPAERITYCPACSSLYLSYSTRFIK